MLTEEFRKQRARQVRDLADKAIDPFIKQRLLGLAEKYESDSPPHVTTVPADLQFVVRGNGSER